jgi:hypothetical protein
VRETLLQRVQEDIAERDEFDVKGKTVEDKVYDLYLNYDYGDCVKQKDIRYSELKIWILEAWENNEYRHPHDVVTIDLNKLKQNCYF